MQEPYVEPIPKTAQEKMDYINETRAHLNAFKKKKQSGNVGAPKNPQTKPMKPSNQGKKFDYVKETRAHLNATNTRKNKHASANATTSIPTLNKTTPNNSFSRKFDYIKETRSHLNTTTARKSKAASPLLNRLNTKSADKQNAFSYINAIINNQTGGDAANLLDNIEKKDFIRPKLNVDDEIRFRKGGSVQNRSLNLNRERARSGSQKVTFDNYHQTVADEDVDANRLCDLSVLIVLMLTLRRF